MYAQCHRPRVSGVLLQSLHHAIARLQDCFDSCKVSGEEVNVRSLAQAHAVCERRTLLAAGCAVRSSSCSCSSCCAVSAASHTEWHQLGPWCTCAALQCCCSVRQSARQDLFAACVTCHIEQACRARVSSRQTATSAPASSNEGQQGDCASTAPKRASPTPAATGWQAAAACHHQCARQAKGTTCNPQQAFMHNEQRRCEAGCTAAAGARR